MASGPDLVEQPVRDVSDVSDDEAAARVEEQGAAVSLPRAASSRVARLYALLGLTAVALSAIVVVVLTADGRSRTPSAPMRVALRSATADFALLRSAAAEPLPAGYLRAVRRVPAGYGLMLSGARESKDGVWLIPGRNGLCVFMADSEGRGGSCGSLAAAESEGVSFVVRDARSGQELWTGAVPDGTVRVRALAVDGATLAVATPRSSVYRLTARNIQKISAER